MRSLIALAILTPFALVCIASAPVLFAGWALVESARGLLRRMDGPGEVREVKS